MIYRLGQTVETRHRVRDPAPDGSPVPDLAIGAFDVQLVRGDELAAEVVSITENEDVVGEYAFRFTASAEISDAPFATYTLTLRDGFGGGFQRDFQVWAPGVEIPAGPPATGLTTLEDFKIAFNVTVDDLDTRIEQLIAEVTTDVQRHCGRKFFLGEFAEHFNGDDSAIVLVRQIPIVAIAGVWVSTSVPRVYDSTTLLLEGTDYVVDEATGILTRLGCLFPCGPQSVKVSYQGGFASVPADLARAAREVIDVKLLKASGHLYHVISENRGDGSLTVGGQADQTSRYDWPLGAKLVFDGYRLPRAA